MKKKQLKRVAFVLAWAFLILFVSQMDFVKVGENLNAVGWQFMWVIIVSGLAYGMASVAWLLCFVKLPTQLSSVKLFIYRQIGETLTTINPANIIVGESAKLFLLKKDGINYQDGLVSILLSRILIMLSVVLLILMFPLFIWGGGFASMNFTIQYEQIIALMLGISALFYVFISEKLWLFRFFKFLTAKTNWSFLEKNLTKIQHINELLAQFYKNQKGKLLLAFLLSVFHWLMGAVEIYLLFFFLQLKIPFVTALIIEISVTCIKSMGAFVPGQIGVEEYGNKLMIDMLVAGGDGLWLSISILRRTRQIFWLLVGGLFFWLILRKEKIPVEGRAVQF
jgi:uncharacterized membrane protein YbhN (UPF0104 family)